MQGKAEADSEQFRQRWERYATGVSVDAANERAGNVRGRTAQQICSVATPRLYALVCVVDNRHTPGHITESGRFRANIPNVDRQNIEEHFARPPERREAG